MTNYLRESYVCQNLKKIDSFILNMGNEKHYQNFLKDISKREKTGQPYLVRLRKMVKKEDGETWS